MRVKALIATAAVYAASSTPAHADPPPATPPAATPQPPATPPPPGLRDSLLARAGKTPVYLAFGEAGVVASAVDGAWSVTLVDGQVDGAALDSAQDLLWLTRAGRLEVLDLREPAPKPVRVVDRWYQ